MKGVFAIKKVLSVVLVLALLAGGAVPIRAAPGVVETGSGWKLTECKFISVQNGPFEVPYDTPETLQLFTQWQRENENPTGQFYVIPFSNPPIEVVMGDEAAGAVDIAPGTFTWSVADGNIARLQPGNSEFEAAVIGTGLGLTTLTVTDSDGGSCSLDIQVEPILRVTPEMAKIDVGKTVQLRAEELPTVISGKSIHWLAMDKLTLSQIPDKTEELWDEYDRKIALGGLTAAEMEALFDETLEAITAMVQQTQRDAIAAAKTIASISASGLVTGLADGRITILAVQADSFDPNSLDTDGRMSINACELTVGEPEEIPVKPPVDRGFFQRIGDFFRCLLENIVYYILFGWLWGYDPPIEEVVLSTPLLGQQKTNWCWAASSQMVARTFVNTGKTQTEIVIHVKGSNVNEGGTYTEAIQAIKFATDNTIEYRSSGVISEREIRSNIDKGYPVYLSRGWYPDGTTRRDGHATVIYGYQILKSGNYKFLVRDPSNGLILGTGQNHTWTYAYILSGSDTGKMDGSVTFYTRVD